MRKIANPNESSTSCSTSTSQYTTPLNSPDGSSSTYNSTLMDLSYSLDPSIQMDSRMSMSLPSHTEVSGRLSAASVGTSCTLRPTQHSASLPVIPSSPTRQPQTTTTASNYSNPILSTARLINSNQNSTKFDFLMQQLKELDQEQLLLIGIEQQMSMLSLQCKNLRESIMFRTNVIYEALDFINIERKDASTQTDLFVDRSLIDPNINVLSPSSVVQDRSLNLFSSIDESITLPPVPISQNFDSISPNVLKNFDKLAAYVKGYLTRRLLKTEKVQYTIQCIKDTTLLISNFRNEAMTRNITENDVELHARLMQQLTRNCRDFYDIFFKFSKHEQMALISRSRELSFERQFAREKKNYASGRLTASSLSSATLKVLERKSAQSKSRSAQKGSDHNRKKSSNGESLSEQDTTQSKSAPIK